MRGRLVIVVVTYALLRADRPGEPGVDRPVVREVLMVRDTGRAWEAGYEAHRVPRGFYARAPHDGPGGLRILSRLIKADVDDPFGDRSHAVERDGAFRRAPGLISRNVRLDGAWRPMAIIRGEGLESLEVLRPRWGGSMHPDRLRSRTFRPGLGEPLTDARIVHGMMPVVGGYGGGGLPYPSEALQLWGGTLGQAPSRSPTPGVVRDDGSGEHRYAIVAIGPQGRWAAPSGDVRAAGRATLRWDGEPWADAFLLVRDGRGVAGPLRVEGTRQERTDAAGP